MCSTYNATHVASQPKETGMAVINIQKARLYSESHFEVGTRYATDRS